MPGKNVEAWHLKLDIDIYTYWKLVFSFSFMNDENLSKDIFEASIKIFKVEILWSITHYYKSVNHLCKNSCCSVECKSKEVSHQKGSIWRNYGTTIWCRIPSFKRRRVFLVTFAHTCTQTSGTKSQRSHPKLANSYFCGVGLKGWEKTSLFTLQIYLLFNENQNSCLETEGTSYLTQNR